MLCQSVFDRPQSRMPSSINFSSNAFKSFHFVSRQRTGPYIEVTPSPRCRQCSAAFCTMPRARRYSSRPRHFFAFFILAKILQVLLHAAGRKIRHHLPKPCLRHIPCRGYSTATMPDERQTISIKISYSFSTFFPTFNQSTP